MTLDYYLPGGVWGMADPMPNFKYIDKDSVIIDGRLLMSQFADHDELSDTLK